jgi:type I restriction enzyme, S subunit
MTPKTEEQEPEAPARGVGGSDLKGPGVPISQNWKSGSLGDFIELKRGYDLPSSVRRAGSVPIVSSSGVSGSHAEAKVSGPGVVTGRYGTIGQVFFIEEDFWPLNTTLYVRDFKGNDPQFVSYFLRTFDFNSFSDKAAVPGVNRNHLHMAQVQFPDLSEQRRIASILSAFDDKIELNRRMNETLEAMARAIFKSWFVDFDPVRAKAEGRQPKGIPAHIADLFPNQLQDSPLGPIPKGWETRPFDQSVEIIGGGTPKTSVEEYWNGDMPWFSVVDAPRPEDVWVIATEKHITRRGLEESSTRILLPGTTIISARGTVGRVALCAVQMAMNQSCYGLKGTNGIGSFATYFITRTLADQLQQRAHGSVFDTITRSTLAGVQHVAGSDRVQAAFEEQVRPFMELIRSNVHEARLLGVTRDVSLPRLLLGEFLSARVAAGNQTQRALTGRTTSLED